MTFKLEEDKLSELLEKAVIAGTNKALSDLGLKKSLISQRETIRRYGHSRVMRWRMDGKIVPVKSGRKIYFNIDDLERLNKMNELYFKKESGKTKVKAVK